MARTREETFAKLVVSITGAAQRPKVSEPRIAFDTGRVVERNAALVVETVVKHGGVCDFWV
jgi:hypothetical protein